MPKRDQIYKCQMCGNIVEVLYGGSGELVCCGEPMELLTAKTADQGREKHVPVVEKTDGKVTVSVGDVPHPMEEKHYIEWIEILADGKIYRQFLTPGSEPKAVFEIEANNITAREHCNVHGLWEGA